MTMTGRAASAQDGGRTRMSVRVGIAGSLVGAVLLAAIMAFPLGVSAQEPSPRPAPTPMTELDTSDLVALFPTTVADMPYTAHSTDGADWIENLTHDPGTVTFAQGLTEALAAHGRDPSDLTVAFGEWPDPQAFEPFDLRLVAFRIEDGDPSWLVPALTDPDAVLTQVELGGKTVSAVGQPGQPPQSYLYVSGDVLWLISESFVSFLLADLP